MPALKITTGNVRDNVCVPAKSKYFFIMKQ